MSQQRSTILLDYMTTPWEHSCTDGPTTILMPPRWRYHRSGTVPTRNTGRQYLTTHALHFIPQTRWSTRPSRLFLPFSWLVRYICIITRNVWRFPPTGTRRLFAIYSAFIPITQILSLACRSHRWLFSFVIAEHAPLGGLPMYLLSPPVCSRSVN